MIMLCEHLDNTYTCVPFLVLIWPCVWCCCTEKANSIAKKPCGVHAIQEKQIRNAVWRLSNKEIFLWLQLGISLIKHGKNVVRADKYLWF